eukprot:TRINITY_DN3803_c0_g1_i12.p1 TRINITY_DN3803_c0_g1~~TRINITY_DN3803_c0_g1_i12.p1  ORF type:complete len:406 (+),score=89.25 TRINITY_DN3803_c0_g1_i12:182-1399(+)
MNFLERFKGKIGKIGRNGNIDLNDIKPIETKSSFGCGGESARTVFHSSVSPIAMQSSKLDFAEPGFFSFPVQTTLLNQPEKEQDKSFNLKSARGLSNPTKHQHNYFSEDLNKRKPKGEERTITLTNELKAISQREIMQPATSLWSQEATPRSYRKITQTVNKESEVGKISSMQSTKAKPKFTRHAYPPISEKLITEIKKPPLQGNRRAEAKLLSRKKSEVQSDSVVTANATESTESKVLKNAAYHYLSSGKLWPGPDLHRSEDQSASNISTLSAPNPSKYRPYRISEYREIKPSRYYTLGGLGPNLGGEDWKERIERTRRMHEYARNVQELNKDLRAARKDANNPPAAEDKRKKMLDYARKVPKPKLSLIMEVDEGLAEGRLGNPFLQGLGCICFNVLLTCAFNC